jgi:cytochrome c biogenesis protein CcmG, thiol:disulfide interchange protein DsbE
VVAAERASNSPLSHRYHGLMRRFVAAVVVLLAMEVACTSGSDQLPRLEGESVIDGSALSSADFEGNILVVNAWATWCKPCELEQPALLNVLNRYQDRGVSFLGIDHLDDRATARDWIENRFHVTYPSLFDPAGEFAAKLGYPGLPATFVVDRTGTIRFRQFGPITERMLSSMLDRVLAG